MEKPRILGSALVSTRGDQTARMIATNLPKMIFKALLLATVMSIAAPAQTTFKTLLNWNGNNGSNPFGGLVQGRDGNLYGMTFTGGNSNSDCWDTSCGTVFRITPGGKLNTLYRFCPQSDCTDGAQPVAGLVVGTDGNLYGTTPFGGSAGLANTGTAFKITTAGKLTRLYGFCPNNDCNGGAEPEAGLVEGSDGNFYGTTVRGGLSELGCGVDGTCGVVFKITPGGKLATLYKFCSQSGCADGSNPLAGLIQGSDGNFYGVTGVGDNTSGTVFKITPTGKLTTLYTFCLQSGCPDGFSPSAALQEGNDGNFYGTTNGGGSGRGDGCNSGGCGTVFKITPQGKLTTLYSFCTLQNCIDGKFPYAGLTLGSDGNFYGTTPRGGAKNNACTGRCGTVFKITPQGKLTTLHRFCGQKCGEGSYPFAGLLQRTDGAFYGVTRNGGINGTFCDQTGCGTLFRISTGLGPFVALVNNAAKVGAEVQILGQGLKGTTAVSFSGTAAQFKVASNTYLTATVPAGVSTGYVTVTTAKGKLVSNRQFRLIR